MGSRRQDRSLVQFSIGVFSFRKTKNGKYPVINSFFLSQRIGPCDKPLVPVFDAYFDCSCRCENTFVHVCVLFVLGGICSKSLTASLRFTSRLSSTQVTLCDPSSILCTRASRFCRPFCAKAHSSPWQAEQSQNGNDIFV